jgi:hypothetical protein
LEGLKTYLATLQTSSIQKLTRGSMAHVLKSMDNIKNVQSTELEQQCRSKLKAYIPVALDLSKKNDSGAFEVLYNFEELEVSKGVDDQAGVIVSSYNVPKNIDVVLNFFTSNER